jgi:hypothetical protein
MRRFPGVAVVVVAAGLAGPARADDAEATAVLDKAIAALGGAERLGKAEGFTWKNRATVTINGSDNSFNSEVTAQGVDKHRAAFEGDFNGNRFEGVTVLNGEKGWRKFGDMLMEMDADSIANEQRTIYLALGAATVLPLKGKGFQVQSAGEQDVGGKPAAVLKVTGPDGKESTLYFDKVTGLPAKQVGKVIDFTGQEYTQETTYDEFKDFNGIKQATRIIIARDGEPFVKQEVVEFKALDKVDPELFEEPK